MDLEFHKEYQRKLISDKVAKPVRDAAIIHLIILKDGPRDLRKVNAIIEELKRKKDKAENAIDTEFYLTQIEAYEILLRELSKEQSR